jgi:hypothetical protein
MILEPVCPQKLAHLLAALYAVREGLTDAGAVSEQEE